jgi:hypothetical protein
MGEMRRNVYKSEVIKVQGRDYLGNLGIDGNIILK